MTKSKRIMIGGAGAVLWLLVFGFVMFATSVMREPAVSKSRADGIVVLTGGQTRIAEGSRLLKEGWGERLLISGVNPQTRRATLQRLSGLEKQKFACCVDVDNAADTVGNAAETRKWSNALNYNRLIIVTASYHMPRSLAELARAMPDKELIPHPVVPKNLRRNAWWLDPWITRLLLSEYVKFLPAAARLAFVRALDPWSPGAVTADAGSGPKS
jgi:uncharacterized SAM-binding protein YcdF (DUF218 family)